VEQSGFWPSLFPDEQWVECFHRVVFVDARHGSCGAKSSASSILLAVADDLCGDLPAILIHTEGLDLLLDLR
jgi:hypothetical protein